MIPLVRAFCAALLLLAPSYLRAQENAPVSEHLQPRTEQIIDVLKGDTAPGEVFAPSFLAAVPEAQLRTLAAQLETQFGSLQGVESVEPAGTPGAPRIALRFERAIGRGYLQLDPAPPHQVTGLRLTTFDPLGDSAEKLITDLRQLPGVTSAWLTRLGADTPILAHEPDRQLAIGSTFKLYVLSALAREIAAGTRRWSDVVPLGQRSLQSGITQGWPPAAPVTLHTLATLMISISDNTATDTLIGLVGREAVEAEMAASGHSAPERNLPFLTTRESFLLKSGDRGVLHTFISGGEIDRRGVLASLKGQDIDMNAAQAAFNGRPRALEVEWFASARDIARMLERIRQLGDETVFQILAINSALGERREQWGYAGYKGGSEAGVLNLSWLLRDRSGEWYAATLGWNNPDAALENQQLELLSQRLLALVPR